MRSVPDPERNGKQDSVSELLFNLPLCRYNLAY